MVIGSAAQVGGGQLDLVPSLRHRGHPVVLFDGLGVRVVVVVIHHVLVTGPWVHIGEKAAAGAFNPRPYAVPRRAAVRHGVVVERDVVLVGARGVADGPHVLPGDVPVAIYLTPFQQVVLRIRRVQH